MIEHNGSVRVRMMIGGLSFAALRATVVTAYLTRSTFAGVNALGGVFIGGSCVVVIGVASGLIRSASWHSLGSLLTPS